MCYFATPCLQSKPQLEESLVVNSDTGKFMKSTVRTSLGAQFGRGFDDVFKRIEKRIASLTMIPVGEGNSSLLDLHIPQAPLRANQQLCHMTARVQNMAAQWGAHSHAAALLVAGAA
eukprot:GHRQ01039640.1.p2 GENE.GHRQ01039640.1~~GHRQ01039640.1.p2  ORF type:complete len:117 (-),score=27.36 GHRQ01039640.1:276-626(-)